MIAADRRDRDGGRGSRALLPPLLLVLVSTAGCQSWEAARRDVIEPLNALLHRDYPGAYRSGDADLLAALFDADLLSRPGFRDSLERDLERLATIERAHAVIESVDFDGAPGEAQARVALSLHGVTATGRRVSLARRERLTCRTVGGEWKIVGAARGEEEVHEAEEILFADESELRGLVFRHTSGGVEDRWGGTQDYTPGSGLAVGDFDGDGFDDVFLVAGRRSRLFRNVGGLVFTDETESAGLSTPPEGEARHALFADYDNDGHLDLLVGMLGAPDLLFRNNGDGTFTESARAAGLRPTGESTGACFADFNNDGHLDLYVANGDNLLRKDPSPIFNARNATPNQLYIANGDGTLTERTEEAGVGDTGWALACSAFDFDLDGDMDIFVANDFGFDVLYRNRGDGTFDDATLSAGLTRRGASMSSDWGDFDGDGRPDLFVAGMSSNSRWILEHPAFPAPAPWYVNLLFRDRVLDIFAEMFHGNWLYRNRGDGTFEEISVASGVRNNGWAWSSLLLDYDNDGLLDVYGVNGFRSGKIRKDL